MTFYKIYHPISKKVYGTSYPNFGSNIEESFYKPNSIFQQKEFSDQYEDVIVPKLWQHHKSAKITDMLNTGALGNSGYHIISERLKKILENYNLYEIAFYKTIFTTLDGRKLNYYYMMAKKEAIECIDFLKSDFAEWEVLSPHLRKTFKYLEFKNITEYKEYRNSDKPSLQIVKLNVNRGWGYDLFVLKSTGDMGLCFIASNKLKQAIEKEALTGIFLSRVNEPTPLHVT